MQNNATRRKNIFSDPTVEACSEAGADALMADAMLPVDELLDRLATSIDGLTEWEARLRQRRDGPNELQSRLSLTVPSGVIAAGFCLPLLAVAVIYLFSIGSAAIASLLMLTAALGFSGGFVLGNIRQNDTSHDEFDAPVLAKRRLRIRTTMSRDSDAFGTDPDFHTVGELIEVPARALVVGDIVHLAAIEGGYLWVSRVVAADMRVLSANNLLVDQSPLQDGALRTICKSAEAPAIAPDHPLDLPNICFAGSRLLAGNGIATVIAIGANTYRSRSMKAS